MELSNERNSCILSGYNKTQWVSRALYVSSKPTGVMYNGNRSIPNITEPCDTLRFKTVRTELCWLWELVKYEDVGNIYPTESRTRYTEPVSKW